MRIHDFIEYYGRIQPEANCLSLNDKSYTYRDVDDQSNKIANGLLSLGIDKGKRIAILGENSIEHLQLFMAVSKIGAVVVPLNYRLAPPELAYVLGDADVGALLVLPDAEHLLDALKPSLQDNTAVFCQSERAEKHWGTWASLFPDQKPAADVAESDPFIQLYTSGTTGNPKGVVLAHDNLLSLALMSDAATPHRPNRGSNAIVCAPLFHVGGVGALLIAIRAGQNTILHKAFDPQAVVNDIENHAVNSVFMVPAMIMAVLQVPNISDRDFSMLRQIYYGASPMSESLLRQAIEVFQCDFAQMYGMTETTGTVVTLLPEDHWKALAGQVELLKSVGRPCVGAEIKIVDLEANSLPAGEIGEVCVKSPSNMIHYHKLPDATKATVVDGWLHTGDAGYLDDEGYLYLKDRIKDMVVSGGENIYPVEVENVLSGLEAVVDVAVVGIPDKKFGEALLAFVVLKPESTLDLEEMIAFCRDKIAGYKIPRQMKVIDEIPRNASGKVLKKNLRAPFWQGELRAVD